MIVDRLAPHGAVSIEAPRGFHPRILVYHCVHDAFSNSLLLCSVSW